MENVNEIPKRKLSERPRMTRENRAKQFASFACLKGLESMVKWQERIEVDKIELSEERLAEIDNKFKQIKKKDIITVTYFEKNQYLRVTGMVARIDVTARILQVINTKIRFDDIYELELS